MVCHALLSPQDSVAAAAVEPAAAEEEEQQAAAIAEPAAEPAATPDVAALEEPTAEPEAAAAPEAALAQQAAGMEPAQPAASPMPTASSVLAEKPVAADEPAATPAPAAESSADGSRPASPAPAAEEPPATPASLPPASPALLHPGATPTGLGLSNLPPLSPMAAAVLPAATPAATPISGVAANDGCVSHALQAAVQVSRLGMCWGVDRTGACPHSHHPACLSELLQATCQTCDCWPRTLSAGAGRRRRLSRRGALSGRSRRRHCQPRTWAVLPRLWLAAQARCRDSRWHGRVNWGRYWCRAGAALQLHRRLWRRWCWRGCRCHLCQPGRWVLGSRKGAGLMSDCARREDAALVAKGWRGGMRDLRGRTPWQVVRKVKAWLGARAAQVQGCMGLLTPISELWAYICPSLCSAGVPAGVRHGLPRHCRCVCPSNKTWEMAPPAACRLHLNISSGSLSSRPLPSQTAAARRPFSRVLQQRTRLSRRQGLAPQCSRRLPPLLLPPARQCR